MDHPPHRSHVVSRVAMIGIIGVSFPFRRIIVYRDPLG